MVVIGGGVIGVNWPQCTVRRRRDHREDVGSPNMDGELALSLRKSMEKRSDSDELQGSVCEGRQW
ncbi:MAG: hypothetical protein ACLSEX_00855 [Blautia sp.]